MKLFGGLCNLGWLPESSPPSRDPHRKTGKGTRTCPELGAPSKPPTPWRHHMRVQPHNPRASSKATAAGQCCTHSTTLLAPGTQNPQESHSWAGGEQVQIPKSRNLPPYGFSCFSRDCREHNSEQSQRESSARLHSPPKIGHWAISTEQAFLGTAGHSWQSAGY